MAIAKTNASLYSSDSANDDFSVNMRPIALEVTDDFKGIVHGNGKIIAFPFANTSNTIISVSADEGETFSSVTMDFVVQDVIYSDNLSKFIAVGHTTDAIAKAKVETSVDGLEWIEEDFGSPGTNVTHNIAIREAENGFYLMGFNIANSTSSGQIYSIKSALIQFDASGNPSYSNNASISIPYKTNNVVNEFKAIIKGNARTAFQCGSNWYIQSGSTITQATVAPSAFVDGYFIRFDKNSVYKSLNALNYSLVCTSAYELKQACKYDGYYYCFTESKACRVVNLADLANVDSSEYIDTETCTHTAIASMDDYMLLCTSGFVFKTTIDDPKKDATTLMVETLSATESLNQSKEYTNEQVAALIARIEALEGTTTE